MWPLENSFKSSFVKIFLGIFIYILKHLFSLISKHNMSVLVSSKSTRVQQILQSSMVFSWKRCGWSIFYFFRTNDLSPAFNSTIVALVPKCSNLIKKKDFRPILCCFVIYKCITKIMANKLKKCLPIIIERNQSAFLAGKKITYNILMPQELVRGYARSTLSPNV